jgi:hypothetical protein
MEEARVGVPVSFPPPLNRPPKAAIAKMKMTSAGNTHMILVLAERCGNRHAAIDEIRSPEEIRLTLGHVRHSVFQALDR